MNIRKDLEQEIRVLSALAPASLLEQICDPDVVFKEYNEIISFFYRLGFEALSTHYAVIAFRSMYRKEKERAEAEGRPFDADSCFQEAELEQGLEACLYGGNQYIRQFLDNLASEGLRKLFEKKADYY